MTADREEVTRVRPSMGDVARHAGVALGTVSNVLNSPEKVTESTRQKVTAAIAELGYIRNDAARSLAVGSSTAIGLVVADLGNSLFVDIARGAEQVLRQRGMNVLIANSDIDTVREVQNLEVFERARVAGILFAPLDTPLAVRPTLPVHSTPTVLVNSPAPNPGYSSVSVDEFQGGAIAAGHLIAQGRRRLLFVGGPMFLSAVQDRHRGAQHAAAGDGATVALLETSGLNVRHGRSAARAILDLPAGTYDGIVAASDLIAISLVEGLSSRDGYRVPADIAVTGYDNNHFASESTIPITTIGQPGEEMGQVAAELLLDTMSSSSRPVQHRTLEPHLIPRRSTIEDIDSTSV